MSEASANQGMAPGADANLVKELTLPLWQAKGWMKLIGVLSIIEGVLLIPTLVGILFCWLPIWLGVLLMKASGSLELAQLNGDRFQLLEANRKLKTIFTIIGVIVLISLICTAIALFGLIAGGGLLTYLSGLESG